MKIAVKMLAYLSGETRNVELDENSDLVKRVRNSYDEEENYSIDEVLEAVFKYGQNDFQPVEGLPSVSVGDVVVLGVPVTREVRYFRVAMVGFEELNWVQYQDYVAFDHSDRIFWKKEDAA